ncbi:hypothetical protein ACFQ4C_04320 [Larkinella insperata]|uniref:Uncharacterized protein n=1 Tax=Larkinella insperata TaxID=332158 RepID=A0ABW3Q3D1_9BACT|nr:hypothetical protein [Larkinella insperata]
MGWFFYAHTLGLDKQLQLVKQLKSRSGFKKKKSIYRAAVQHDETFLQEGFETRRKHSFNVEWLARTALRNWFGLIGVAAICSSDAAKITGFGR